MNKVVLVDVVGNPHYITAQFLPGGTEINPVSLDITIDPTLALDGINLDLCKKTFPEHVFKVQS